MCNKAIKTNGFTIIEALVATIIVGLAIVALVMANGVFTQANAAAVNLSTAQFLVEQIRELTAVLPVVDPTTEDATFGAEEGSLVSYDDLDDFDGVSYSPPINASRAAMSDLSSFTQQITVENVNSSNFNQTVADHSSPFVKVTVTVSQNSNELASATWLRARY